MKPLKNKINLVSLCKKLIKIKVSMQTLLIIFLLIPIFSFAQIEDIKKKATENKSNDTNNTFSTSDDDNSNLAEGCGNDIFSCCWNNGFPLIIGGLIKNHKAIMNRINSDASVMSVDIRMAFNLGLHKGVDQNYTYVNYLPGIRGNLGAFSTDFRFNLLTEYTDGFPNSFTVWEWLFLINISGGTKFKLTIGSGIESERFTNSYFNEHYIGFRFRNEDDSNIFLADTRFSMDYSSGTFPFFEGALHDDIKIFEFNNINTYIRLAAVYQNYYSSHDIWAIQTGVIVNFH